MSSPSTTCSVRRRVVVGPVVERVLPAVDLLLALLLVGPVLALLLGVVHPVRRGVGRRVLGRHGVAHEELADDHRERQPVQGLGDHAVAVLPVAQRHGAEPPVPGSDRVIGSDRRGSKANDAAGADPGHRDLVEARARAPHGVRRSRSSRCPVPGDLDVEVRVDGAHRRLERPHRAGPHSVIQPPSSWAGPCVTARAVDDGRVDVRRRVEQRVQRERARASVPSARWIRSAATPAMPTSCFVAISGRLLRRVSRGRARASRKPRLSRCIWTHTSSAMRTSAECENAAKSRSETSGPA